jgi:pseudaminic acid biosynthesis-associated methylase
MSDSLKINEFQRDFWKGEFGNSYADRNISVEETNQMYKERTGITFEDVFKKIFSNIDKNAKILELGCNVGLKLSILQKLGFTNLTGVEINEKAFKIAKKNYPNIKFHNSSIEEFNSNGEQFDLVYTSGVLIHINPKALPEIIKKIISLSKEYIFDSEYYSDKLVEVNYRGHEETLWKQNFPQLFLNQDSKLKIIKQEKIYWKTEDLCDIICLLKKSVDE